MPNIHAALKLILAVSRKVTLGTASSAPLTPEIRRIACRSGVFAVKSKFF
jgi:predicted secreted protein